MREGLILDKSLIIVVLVVAPRIIVIIVSASVQHYIVRPSQIPTLDWNYLDWIWDLGIGLLLRQTNKNCEKINGLLFSEDTRQRRMTGYLS